ncbi:TetR/AcrR family transcriptional regulator [Pseudonocardia humida]|uniref:TetR/AcrR family transcriptional regulator n=1 Tax=Pseudonocardia humida TaxID=2800819 RepID=A0ABT0ZU09_9PSEU|nr:TetR/AcrR family transcriptional regulator [Pseudonocardia humida]MCO1654216.1 TetR/AcrR family transcriptional regulator [Pseudonocardia humida]
MTDPVKTPGRRRYHAPQRAEQAAATRRTVLEAARALFTANGYTATTVGQIADRAGVAVDTVYATVGRKPVLLREVFETALSGRDVAVPAEERDYVRAVRAAPTAAGKIAAYARALTAIAPRTAPVQAAIRDAAAHDRACAALDAELADRRAANMRLFAADLRATGELRADLSDDDVADVVWGMASAEYYLLMVRRRGWTPQRYGEHLRDAWTRMLLADPPATGEA